jgi:hypothetical protein
LLEPYTPVTFRDKVDRSFALFESFST